MIKNIVSLEADKTKELAKVLSAVAHENRINILRGFNKGDNLSEVLTKIGISRSTLQNHIEMLNNAGLIEKVPGKNPYKLTYEGKQTLKKIEDIEKEIIQPRYDKQIKLKKQIFEETKKTEELEVFASALNLGIDDLKVLLEKLREGKKT
jgi:predicted transcriptional regulator